MWLKFITLDLGHQVTGMVLGRPSWGWKPCFRIAELITLLFSEQDEIKGQPVGNQFTLSSRSKRKVGAITVSVNIHGY